MGSWATTLDHKRIGRLYAMAAGIFFLLGGGEALLLRVQLMKPAQQFVTGGAYDGLFVLHGVSMIGLALLPGFTALASFLVPLQIGARRMACPRLHAFSFWSYLVSGLLLSGWLAIGIVQGHLLSAAPDPAWAGARAMDTWLLGQFALATSGLAFAACLLVTVCRLRAPGLGLARLPLFSWASLLAQALLAGSLPFVWVGLAGLLLDRFAGTSLSAAAPLAWQRLFWLSGHPVLAAALLPALGIAAEVAAVFAGRRLVARQIVVAALVAIALLAAVAGLAQLAPPRSAAFASDFSTTLAALLALPLVVVLGAVLGTLAAGRARLSVPVLFVLGMVGLLALGGLSGLAQLGAGRGLQGSAFTVAHLHLVLVGGSLMGLWSGLYYWWPKLYGRVLDAGLGRLHFWSWSGFLLAGFLPMLALGRDGMPRRIFGYAEASGWDEWSMLASLGAFAMGGASLVFVYNAILSGRRGHAAPADPWDGATLEWAIPSPPPAHGFDRLPRVSSERPYWDEKVATPPAERLARHWEPAGPPPPAPGTSVWPLLAGLGLAGLLGGSLLPEAVRLGVQGLATALLLVAAAAGAREASS